MFSLGTKMETEFKGVKRDTIGLGEFLVGLCNATCMIQFLLNFLLWQASCTHSHLLVWARFYEM